MYRSAICAQYNRGWMRASATWPNKAGEMSGASRDGICKRLRALARSSARARARPSTSRLSVRMPSPMLCPSCSIPLRATVTPLSVRRTD